MDEIQWFKHRGSAIRAGRRWSAVNKTDLFTLCQQGTRTALLTTQEQLDFARGIKLGEITQHFTYNRVNNESKA